MLNCRIVEGIRSDTVCDRLLRQGADLTMAHAVDICRADEITKEQMKTLTEQVSDIGAVHKKQDHKFPKHQQEQRAISRRQQNCSWFPVL